MFTVDDQTVNVVSSSGDNFTLDIINSNVFFSVWLNAGADVKLFDSQIALFPSFSASTALSNVGPGMFGVDGVPEVVMFGPDIRVEFNNTELLILNIYFEGTGSYSLTDSLVGETTCRDSATCEYDEVFIDGMHSLSCNAQSDDFNRLWWFLQLYRPIQCCF